MADFLSIKGRLEEGLALIVQGREIVLEATANLALARQTLATQDVDTLDGILERVNEETQALNDRIQRA